MQDFLGGDSDADSVELPFVDAVEDRSRIDEMD
jgi:hypothetical protein